MVREELKMRERGIEIRGAVLVSIWEEMESRPRQSRMEYE